MAEARSSAGGSGLSGDSKDCVLECGLDSSNQPHSEKTRRHANAPIVLIKLWVKRGDGKKPSWFPWGYAVQDIPRLCRKTGYPFLWVTVYARLCTRRIATSTSQVLLTATVRSRTPAGKSSDRPCLFSFGSGRAETASSPRLAGHPIVPGHGLRQVILTIEDKYLKML